MAGKKNDLSKLGRERLERTRIEERYQTARIAIRWFGIAFAVWMAERAVASLSGHSTSVVVNAAFRLLANLQLTVAIALTGAATTWALCERGLRRRMVSKMQARIRDLETKADPDRTSSGLTPGGKTNPRDI